MGSLRYDRSPSQYRVTLTRTPYAKSIHEGVSTDFYDVSPWHFFCLFNMYVFLMNGGSTLSAELLFVKSTPCHVWNPDALQSSLHFIYLIVHSIDVIKVYVPSTERRMFKLTGKYNPEPIFRKISSASDYMWYWLILTQPEIYRSWGSV